MIKSIKVLTGVALILSNVSQIETFASDDYDLYNFDESIDISALEKLEINSGAENLPEIKERPYVIMVSLDGFRHDYPIRHQATNLLQMMKSGSYVQRLIPSFPSKTFPNHYTLVTGMYPAHHGLLGNEFYSRVKNDYYQMSNRNLVRDGTWYGGTPIWVLAEQQGMTSASFFWVGSEADIQHVRPSRYLNYDGRVPYSVRVDYIEKWLELPEEKRPHLILLYYSLTDSAGHKWGPNAPETGVAVRYVDAMIGKLRSYIQSSSLRINLIVTADHGMTEVDRWINVHDLVDLGKNRFISGPMAMIYTDTPSETERIYHSLQGQADIQVYLKNGMPSYLNFSNEDRVGDIVLVTEPPNYLIYSEKECFEIDSIKGTHGYDPYRNPDMGAIFIAEGPDIRPGQVLSPVENIHVYPLLTSILGLIPPEDLDANPAVLAPLMFTK